MPDGSTVLTDTTKAPETTTDTKSADTTTDKQTDTGDKKDTAVTDSANTTDAKTDTTTDTKTTDTKPTVPEKYQLKLPEGSPLKEADLTAVAEEAKALGLSQENAQKFLESRSKVVASLIEGQKQQLETAVAGWAESIKTDSEIAGKDGKDYDANVSRARLVIEKFGSPELKKALNETGLGNHPELVRLMVRVGKGMKEDSFHDGKKTSQSVMDENAIASKFYPTHTSK